MSHEHPKHPDLNRLLGEMPPGEADRLREVWDLIGDDEPFPLSEELDTEDALRRFVAHTNQRVDHHPQRQDRRAAASASQHTPRASTRTSVRAAGGNGSMKGAVLGGYRTRAWMQGGAVALAVILIVASAVYWWQQPVARTAPLGERLAVTLPDGSQVELNSGATVRYARSFSEVRYVRLEGEGYFDVVRDAKPFVVHTFNASVRVLGTRFNVKAWSEDQSRGTVVALEEGRVELVAADASGRAVALASGETRQLISEDGAYSFKPVRMSVEEAVAWRQGDLVFKDQPLSVVVREIERRYAISLTAAPTVRLDTQVSLALRQPSGPDVVIHDLATALGLDYRPTANGYALYAAEF